MEQQTGSKLGKEYIKAVYCHPACLTCMQSTLWEMLGWITHKLESRFPGEISTSSHADDHYIYYCGQESLRRNGVALIINKSPNTRPLYLPPEKSICRSRSNSQNWTWNNRLVPSWERSTSRLYIVTLFI